LKQFLYKMYKENYILNILYIHLLKYGVHVSNNQKFSKVKVKSLCLINYAPYHEDVWGTILDISTRWR
jgi:hypothetical protein